MSFKVGDRVYASDWCKGTIIQIFPKDSEAVVSFSTDNGGGCLPFGFEELEPVKEPPIKEQLLDLCDEMIVLWQKFKKEVQEIPKENNEDLVLKWHNYFEEHADSVCKLSATKSNIQEMEEHLLVIGDLTYKD